MRRNSRHNQVIVKLLRSKENKWISHYNNRVKRMKSNQSKKEAKKTKKVLRIKMVSLPKIPSKRTQIKIQNQTLKSNKRRKMRTLG